MKYVFIKILSFLLFQANSRPYDKPEFYKIKDRILKKHGKTIGYDYQHFNQQECYSCNGTGLHYHYDDEDYGDYEDCWHCGGTGIYNTEKWIGLKKIQFGEYVFHIPIGRVEGKPDSLPHSNIIEGVISHSQKKYTKLANVVLFLVYKRRFIIPKSLIVYNIKWFLKRVLGVFDRNELPF